MINELKYLKTSNEILKNRIHMLNNTINEQKVKINKLEFLEFYLFIFGVSLGFLLGSFCY